VGQIFHLRTLLILGVKAHTFGGNGDHACDQLLQVRRYMVIY